MRSMPTMNTLHEVIKTLLKDEGGVEMTFAELATLKPEYIFYLKMIRAHAVKVSAISLTWLEAPQLVEKLRETIQEGVAKLRGQVVIELLSGDRPVNLDDATDTDLDLMERAAMAIVANVEQQRKVRVRPR